eukprot:670984-Rhodomonas_salina.1
MPLGGLLPLLPQLSAPLVAAYASSVPGIAQRARRQIAAAHAMPVLGRRQIAATTSTWLMTTSRVSTHSTLCLTCIRYVSTGHPVAAA